MQVGFAVFGKEVTVQDVRDAQEQVGVQTGLLQEPVDVGAVAIQPFGQPLYRAALASQLAGYEAAYVYEGGPSVRVLFAVVGNFLFHGMRFFVRGLSHCGGGFSGGRTSSFSMRRKGEKESMDAYPCPEVLRKPTQYR